MQADTSPGMLSVSPSHWRSNYLNFIYFFGLLSFILSLFRMYAASLQYLLWNLSLSLWFLESMRHLPEGLNPNGIKARGKWVIDEVIFYETLLWGYVLLFLFYMIFRDMMSRLVTNMKKTNNGYIIDRKGTCYQKQ